MIMIYGYLFGNDSVQHEYYLQYIYVDAESEKKTEKKREKIDKAQPHTIKEGAREIYVLEYYTYVFFAFPIFLTVASMNASCVVFSWPLSLKYTS